MQNKGDDFREDDDADSDVSECLNPECSTDGTITEYWCGCGSNYCKECCEECVCKDDAL